MIVAVCGGTAVVFIRAARSERMVLFYQTCFALISVLAIAIGLHEMTDRLDTVSRREGLTTSADELPIIE